MVGAKISIADYQAAAKRLADASDKLSQIQSLALGPWKNEREFWEALAEVKRLPHLGSPGARGSNAIRDQLAIGQHVFKGMQNIPLDQFDRIVVRRTKELLTKRQNIRVIYFDATRIKDTSKSFRIGTANGYFARTEAEMLLADPTLWKKTKIYVNGRPICLRNPKFLLSSYRRSWLLKELE
jgi:hypothetical protein